MLDLAASAFEGDRLRDAPGLLGVCFHARWCRFCSAFLPVFEARQAEVPFPLSLADISSYSDPRWDTFAIRAVPTLVLFLDGRPVWRKGAPLGIGLSGGDIERMVQAAREVAR